MTTDKTTTAIWQEVSTKKGFVCVHQNVKVRNGIGEIFWPVTLNDNKSPESGVLCLFHDYKEALAFARGIYMGVEILA